MTTTDPALEELGRPGTLARPAPRIHPAWWVALVAFCTAIGAAGFRSTPGVLITPLHEEFGWPVGLIGLAVSVNLVLFGLMAPWISRPDRLRCCGWRVKSRLTLPLPERLTIGISKCS